MKNTLNRIVSCFGLIILLLGLSACQQGSKQEKADQKAVARQQSQYAKAQPIPAYHFSLERDLLIKLYNIRNNKVTTHSVWRSDYGMVEGDCPSFGYGLPYDTSLTNPYQSTGNTSYALTSIGQSEPNGIFASTNTAATWVMCIGKSGMIEPHYVESKVTVYPGAVKVDYAKNRVTRSGKTTVTMGK